jgi:hypothetical protein
VPFARGDMRDHIASHRNDHGASHGRYKFVQDGLDPPEVDSANFGERHVARRAREQSDT